MARAFASYTILPTVQMSSFTKTRARRDKKVLPATVDIDTSIARWREKKRVRENGRKRGRERAREKWQLTSR